MGKVRFKWNMAGYRAIRTAPGVQNDLASRGARVAGAAGPGMVVESGITGGRQRARTAVITGTAEARRAEATNRALTRAIDAGR